MTLRSLIPAAWLAVAALPAWGQDAFDACEVFTVEDAAIALGTTAAPEPVNPKVRRPKVVTSCTYTAFKDGKPVAATVNFKISRNENEIQRAFDDYRLQYQTKPMLISGSDAFWSAKTGQMNVRKGRLWMTLSVGGAKQVERDPEPAKKLALVLVKKL